MSASEANFKEFKVSDLMNDVENKFLLTSAVARRARQLKDGAHPLVVVDRETLLPVITALHEMHQQKVRVVLQQAKDETQDMLDKMDEELEGELQEDETEASADDDKKKSDKDKKSSKKSLAA